MCVHFTFWGRKLSHPAQNIPPDCFFTLDVHFPYSHFTGGSDFVSVNQQFSFQSGQTQCVDVTIIQDFVDEVDESFTLELILEYAPFDVPLDTYSVTIVDSGEIAICVFC